jgi:mannose-6-phosphate isomerase
MQRMTGTVQPYAWGSTTAIPALLGEEPTGEPQAELWLGAHPLAPSIVGGRPLGDLIADDPEAVLGEWSVKTFGPRLPYLMKVLAAVQPLSLQAHPSRAQAEAGYAREQAAGIPSDAPDRTYRDDWPKPEVLCALEETEALCGFRDPDETYALFARLGLDAVTALIAPLGDTSLSPEDRLATVFRKLLQLDESERQLIDQVSTRAAEIVGTGSFGEFARTAAELAKFYPGDRGVLAALLMNRLVMHQSDAVFLPPGNLHAYLRGGGVEIMANSDNVMRGGLTPKHIDIDALLSIVDFRPGFAGFVRPVEESPRVWRYPTPAPEFTLWRIDAGAQPVVLPGAGGGRVILITDGTVTIESPTGDLTLGRGESAFITAVETGHLVGDGTAFLGGPGLA